MTATHRAGIISTQRWDPKSLVYVHGYRALCPDCSTWKGRIFPLAMKLLAEAQADDHHEYHAARAAENAGGR